MSLLETNSARTHILTIALEDYFHAPAFRQIVTNRMWSRLESRLERTCGNVLEQLEAVQAQATFFVYPWIAARRPDLIRNLIGKGHEVALAGERGGSFRFLKPEMLREQLRRDRAVVEEACGRRVLGYRVTDVFLGPGDLWALEVLAEEGFAYDSSLSPFLWRFGGERWRRFVHENRFAAAKLWEVPLTSYELSGCMLPVAGGNYFRHFPEGLLRRALQVTVSQNDAPLVLYFRSWDFDPTHPRLDSGSAWGNFRHYRNRHRIVATLHRLLRTYSFASVAQFLKLEQAPIELRPSAAVAVPPPMPAFSDKEAPDKLPVSIIVPCYNEGLGIVYLANTLRELAERMRDQFEVQFVIVDDGSQDDTWSKLCSVFSSWDQVLLLQHEKNKGVAASIATGLVHAREIACSMDCDCTYDPNELIPMLQLMRDDVDLVTASPYHPSGRVSNVPEWRLGLSRGASFLYRTATGRKLHTFTACFRVYRRSAVIDITLRYPGFLGIAELLSILLLRGRTVIEHPATLQVRVLGRSKMKVARTVAGHLALLSRIALARVRKGSTKPVKVDTLVATSPSSSTAASEVRL